MDPLTLASLAGGAGSLIQGGLGFLGSQNQAKASAEASKMQTQLQAQALQAQMIQNQRNQENIQPFLNTGTGAANMLTQQLPSLTQAFNPIQAQLEQTPGYQFTKSQGLKAVENSAAARGLGVSGAAQKGAANYATGLADNTLNTQANIFWNNQNNAYNKLYGTAALGSNAAVGAGTLGQSNVNSQTNLLTGMGNTQAAGILGQAAAQNQGLGAIGSGLSSIGSLAYMNQLFGGQGGGMFGGGMSPAQGTLGMAGPGFAEATANPALYGVQGYVP
jgi:hypothetical protein